MSPAIATLLTVVGIVYLLCRDAVRGEATDGSLWLPVLWLAITGSRFPSQWLDLSASTSNFEEGSPLDAAYFAVLMLAGAWVLSRRQVRLLQVMRQNKWLAALVILGLVSVLWSDFPFVAGKRWVKALGHPIMALVVVTHDDPKAAIRTVFKRVAFVLLPLSVLFIKYLPEYGRGFDPWTGEGVNRGVGITKNDLGYVCMVSGVVFAWSLLSLGRLRERSSRAYECLTSIGFLAMAVWLLVTSNSATSLMALLVAVTAMLLVSTRFVSKRFFMPIAVAAVLVAIALNSTFDVYDNVVRTLGRNPTLTDRTALWSDVIAMQLHPWLGYGFESFWLGPRLEFLWEKWWWRPTQAHNGFIETYLNLGWVGVSLLGALLVSTLRRIAKQLPIDLDMGRFRLAFLLAILLFNYTEAAFKAVHFIWTLFYMVAMERPVQSPAR